MACHHEWTTPVVRGTWTQALSGEITPRCPKCNAPAVQSGPNKAFLHMAGVSRAVTQALVPLVPGAECGWSLWADSWADGPQWEITFRRTDLPTFYLHQEERDVEFKSIGVVHRRRIWKWIVNVIVTKTPSNRDEPPYDDNFEVSVAGSAESALIEAILCYFRNGMYDSISATEQATEEAWPD